MSVSSTTSHVASGDSKPGACSHSGAPSPRRKARMPLPDASRVAMATTSFVTSGDCDASGDSEIPALYFTAPVHGSM